MHLHFDRLYPTLQRFTSRNELLGRVNDIIVHLPDDRAVCFIDARNLFDLVAEKLDPDCFFVFVRRDHLHNVSPHAESAARKFVIVPRIINIEQLS